MLSVAEQMRVIESGVANIVPRKALEEKLAKGIPLTIKLGVDPTAPDLHLGHAVPLQKMRQFQDLGHNVVLLIGGGTALIGDPSGRDTTRPQITSEEIEKNAQTYIDQAMRVLDPAKTIVKNNADWILSLDLKELLELCSRFTVARILERDDFTKRYQSQLPISLHEFLYPVMQAYDSVVLKADVEMGGNDQLFNLLAGRELMEKLGMEPQVCVTMPLLEGTDGVRKMSKSYGNYVGLTDTPDEMFGKIMSIPDEMIVRYLRLASTVSVDEIEAIEKGLADKTAHPNKVKRMLAQNIIGIYHDDPMAGQQAEDAFDRLFKSHEIPEDIPEASLAALADKHPDLMADAARENYRLPNLLKVTGLVQTTSEARRMIDQGGCKLDGTPCEKGVYELAYQELTGRVLQVGKRKFVRLLS